MKLKKAVSFLTKVDLFMWNNECDLVKMGWKKHMGGLIQTHGQRRIEIIGILSGAYRFCRIYLKTDN